MPTIRDFCGGETYWIRKGRVDELDILPRSKSWLRLEPNRQDPQKVNFMPGRKLGRSGWDEFQMEMTDGYLLGRTDVNGEDLDVRLVMDDPNASDNDRHNKEIVLEYRHHGEPGWPSDGKGNPGVTHHLGIAHGEN
jgi:hypothetical protein